MYLLSKNSNNKSSYTHSRGNPKMPPAILKHKYRPGEKGKLYDPFSRTTTHFCSKIFCALSYSAHNCR